MKPGIVRVDRVYPHDKARVWRAITEPELLAQWLMPNDFEAKVGHRFTFRTEPGPGFDGVIRCEVIDLVPLERLELTWRGGPLDTRVVFTLTDADGGTRLVMEHTGFRGLKARLVQRILSIGCRTLYGKRLPALLDDLGPPGAGPGPRPPADREEACMGKEQGALSWLLGRFDRPKNATEEDTSQ